MHRDYYDVLGVSRNADIQEIKSAYRRLAKQFHPDVSQVPHGEERFREVGKAYEVLSNRVKRARYDRTGSADFTSRGARRKARPANQSGRKYGAEQKSDSEQETRTEQNRDAEDTSRARSSERHSRTGTPRSENMSYDSSKYDDASNPLSPVKIGFGLAIAGIVILFLISPQIASFFLSLSRAANHNAHNQVLESFLDPRPTYTLRPTYTPLPTQTQLPTLTPWPTHTPRPTYTPYPTPTPIPLAFVIQQLETQAQLVVVQNEIALREFDVGVDDGLCSHGGEFTVQGVIEAGIDFAAIDENRVSYNADERSYLLELPAPEVTSCRIEYIRLRENSFSICNPDWDRARLFAEVQAMSQFLKESEEADLLQEAAERSTEVLGDFVHTLTGRPVNIRFEERDGKPIISSSCAPEAPSGWYHDTSRNVWKRIGG